MPSPSSSRSSSSEMHQAEIDFYVRALGASEGVRYINRRQGTVSQVADLAIGDALLSVTEEAPAWNAHAPPSLGGSPVVLQLHVEDVDGAFETMCAAGATVVFPVVEFCGERMARLRDLRAPLGPHAANRGADARGGQASGEETPGRQPSGA